MALPVNSALDVVGGYELGTSRSVPSLFLIPPDKSRINWEISSSIPSPFFILWRKTRNFSVSLLVWSSFGRFRKKLGNCRITPRLLLVGECLGKPRKCSVLLLICPRRFMETKKSQKSSWSLPHSARLRPEDLGNF